MNILKKWRTIIVKQKLKISCWNQTYKRKNDIIFQDHSNGGIHPISKTQDLTIIRDMGYEVKEGPHIEDDYHNFTALNISENHPARQDHDTFYMSNKKKLLRTHTSPVQIRVMKEEKLPIKIIAPGATYRCDDDSTLSNVSSGWRFSCW